MRWRKTNNGKRVADGCRNHGPCGVCLGNRLHSARVREQAANYADPPPNDHYFDPYEIEEERMSVIAPEPAPVVVYRPLGDTATFRKMLSAQHRISAGRDSAGRTSP